MINSLRLINFRSYQNDTFEFSPGVTIIVGPNASGKTNLLEALQVVCSGKSYRARPEQMIAFSADLSRLEARLDDQVRSVAFLRPAAAERAERVEKHITINQQKYKLLPPSRRLPVVLFEPEHLRLLHAGPEHRRDFLDHILEQIVAGFTTLSRQYKRALAQRNSLLKQASASGLTGSSSNTTKQLFAWNVRLSQLGGQLAAHRQNLTEQIDAQLADIYRQIAGPSDITLTYQPQFSMANYSSQMLHKLERSTELDFARGFTAYGPHREDFAVSIGGHAASAAASRGEVRTALLALKIIELRLLENHFAKKPLLLLDDVFSELDGSRRRALTKLLRDYQTFITTTDADVVVPHFIGNCSIIPTSKGG